LLSAIFTSADFDENFVKGGISSLQDEGLKTGAHRGSHRHPEAGKCDCGFADKMPTIFQLEIDRRGDITKRLNKVYNANIDKIGQFDIPFSELIENAYRLLEKYSAEKIKLTGVNLLSTVEQKGTVIENVEGDHAEAVAFVNLKPGTTFDTNQSNREGNQAINLDLWAAVDQSGKLGVGAEFAMAASLILYQATEIILVENNGKRALPIVIHS
jgi:hypothetical protein